MSTSPGSDAAFPPSSSTMALVACSSHGRVDAFRSRRSCRVVKAQLRKAPVAAIYAQRESRSGGSGGGGGIGNTSASRQALRSRLRCQGTGSGQGSTSSEELEREEGGGGGGGRNNNGNNGNGGQGRRDNSSGDESSSSSDSSQAMSAKEVQAFLDENQIQLPEDMQRKADIGEMPREVLENYAQFRRQAMLGALVASIPALRDRLLADERFFFKINAEIVIDSACATVAEVKQRADMFWKEFDFYASDMIVGIVMDIVLVGLMAPVLRAGIAKQAVGSTPGIMRALNAALAKLPSSCFERSPKGITYTLNQRVACYFVKGLQYSLAGLICGFAGQGIANSLIDLKRYLNPGMEIHVDKPDVIKTALVWGLFMGVSSNTRYMAVNGLERLIEDSVLAQSVPAVANIGTVVVRLMNNIYGGIQFVDLVRFFGVQ